MQSATTEPARESVDRTVTTSLILGLCVLMLVSFLSYRNSSSFAQVAELRRRASMLLIELRRIYGLVTTAETGARGFILSGDESYLEPYESALAALRAEFAAARRLIGDDREARDKFDDIEKLVTARLDHRPTRLRSRQCSPARRSGERRRLRRRARDQRTRAACQVPRSPRAPAASTGRTARRMRRRRVCKELIFKGKRSARRGT